MSKKNKKNRSWPTAPLTEQLEQVEVIMEDTVKKSTSFVPIDQDVMKLLKRTADRNKIPITTLITLAVDALVGSLSSYNYNCQNADNGDLKAVVGGDGEGVVIPPRNFDDLNAIGLYFGVRIVDLLRDALLAQRFNWQRLQPVNARSASTLRLHMFQLEQLGRG